MKNEEFENYKDNYKLIDWINKNYGWIIGVGTIFIALITGIFKVIEYLQVNTYFNFYRIDYNFYESKNIGVFNTIFSNVIIFMLVLSGILSIYYLKKERSIFKSATINTTKKTRIKRKMKYYKENIYIILCLILTNAILIYYTLSELSLISFILDFFTLFATECIFVIIINKENSVKNTTNNLKRELERSLIFLPILIFIIIICFTLSDTLIAYTKKNYRLIDENKVIVYTNENYYIVLNCKIEGNNLIIYRGTQQKIENNLISTELTKFEKIIFN